jgi:hypothetical protein
MSDTAYTAYTATWTAADGQHVKDDTASLTYNERGLPVALHTLRQGVAEGRITRARLTAITVLYDSAAGIDTSTAPEEASTEQPVPYSDLVDRIANLAMNGIYEPGQYTRRGGLSAGLLHDDGQGGAWFYVETTQNNTERERVRITVTPA